jgi:hypothetical protein
VLGCVMDGVGTLADRCSSHRCHWRHCLICCLLYVAIIFHIRLKCFPNIFA